ncbi:hypothetical protein BH23BAC3_BH23BAC3_30580 [soil metagenome]
MHLRMVEATVKQEKGDRLGYIYTEIILKAFENIPGCIFAGLLQSQDETNKYISLTLWRSEKDAEIYVQSGGYKKNLATVQHVLQDENEWKIQLTRENNIEYTAIPSEPNVKSYPVAKSGETLPLHLPAINSSLRILSLKINEGFREEFARIYNSEILPELKEINGCRYAFLLDNYENDGEMISFSIWDDEASIEHYETTGRFREFMGKISHTLGDLYKWKMSLESRSGSVSTITSQDMGVSKFTLITGKKFD